MKSKLISGNLKLHVAKTNPCGNTHSGKCGTGGHKGNGHGWCKWCKICNP